jgi:hypothetical protein
MPRLDNAGRSLNSAWNLFPQEKLSVRVVSIFLLLLSVGVLLAAGCTSRPAEQKAPTKTDDGPRKETGDLPQENKKKIPR